jgi:hypothetical protein
VDSATERRFERDTPTVDKTAGTPLNSSRTLSVSALYEARSNLGVEARARAAVGAIRAVLVAVLLDKSTHTHSFGAASFNVCTSANSS